MEHRPAAEAVAPPSPKRTGAWWEKRSDAPPDEKSVVQKALGLTVPQSFLALAENVLAHRDPQRHALVADAFDQVGVPSPSTLRPVASTSNPER